MVNSDSIISGTGKKSVNKNTNYDFRGHESVPKSLQNSIDGVGTASRQAASAGVFAFIGTLTLSSLCTNSLSGISKLIQIVEFTAMIALFNFEFDPLLGNFFSQLAKMTEFDLIPFPINDLVSNLENSIASQWKGKISEAEIAPEYLQEFGYTGILMV